MSPDERASVRRKPEPYPLRLTVKSNNPAATAIEPGMVPGVAQPHAALALTTPVSQSVRPSSTVPSQLSSAALQVSAAPGKLEGASSSQSEALMASPDSLQVRLALA